MPIPSNLEQDLDLLVQKGMEAWNIPGLAVTIVKDDQLVLSKGYGLRDINKPDPVDEDTLFAIASNTKAFTAAAIGLLVQDGKLAWDDPVTEYLPWFRLHDEHATQLITIRDLLCHRSGLGTWAGDILQLSDFTTEEVIRRVRHIPPAYPFRAGYGYSNLMFITAGLVLTAVSGLSWDQFIQQRLFEPMGITNSVTNARFFDGRTNIAEPHEEIEGEVRVVSRREDAGFGAAGSILASAREIALWLRLHLNNGCLDGKQIIDESIITEMKTPQTVMPIQPFERKLFPSRHFAAYGLGWFLNDHHGRMIVRHTGGLDGMLSSTLMVPEENLGIAIFTDKLPNFVYLALTYHLVDRFLGIDSQDWLKDYLDYGADIKGQADEARQKLHAGRVTGTHHSLPLKEFAGTYESLTAGGAAVRVGGHKLHLQLEAHETLSGELTHWHYDSFMCKWDDPVLGESLVPFITDGQGHVTEFKVKIREDWIDPLEHIFVKCPSR